MAYRIQPDADGHYSILVDDKLAYRLEHSAPNETQSWGLFVFQGGRPGRCIEVAVGAKKLLQDTVRTLIRAGHLAEIDDGHLALVPSDARDFKVSSLGFLACNLPLPMTLSQKKLPKQGSSYNIRRATQDEIRMAGVTLEGEESAVVVNVC